MPHVVTVPRTCCDPRPGVTQDGLAVRRGTGQRAPVRLPGGPAAGPAGEPAAPAPAATLALADRRQGRRHLRGLARPAEPPGPGGRVRAALQLLRRGAARHPALHAQGRLHVDAGGLRGAAVRGSGVPAGRQLPGPLPVRVLHLPAAAAAGGRGLPPARLQDQAVPRAQRGPAVLLLGPQHRAGRAP
ncbi:hypothetical protein FOCC_FOCC007660, partial [Frankliniella occidentalis]